jgi:hypothetical protein
MALSRTLLLSPCTTPTLLLRPSPITSLKSPQVGILTFSLGRNDKQP